jgi:hypothetical protein
LEKSIEAISAVLPLRVLGAGGFYADHFDRCRILLTSLSKFTAADFFETIFVVAPPREFPDVATFCRTWNSLPLTVINEEGLLPALRDFPDLMGWYRQQLIKLAAANLVNTEFFLTLDADVILCKPLQIEILVRSGRALMHPEDRHLHTNWWSSSAEVLGVAVNLSMPGMSVTPAILSRTICQRLFSHLRERYGQHWASALMQRTDVVWTEYTLYYLIAEHYGLLEKFHVTLPAAPSTRLLCPSNVWAEADFKRWDLDTCFDPTAPGFFTIMQSNTRIPTGEVRRRLTNYLPLHNLIP